MSLSDRKSRPAAGVEPSTGPPSTPGSLRDGAPGGRRPSRRNAVTLGAIFGLPLVMYLIATAVNLLLPCGPDYSTSLVRRSLVQIAAGGSGDLAPTGTGFAVSGDGHILTSRRVVLDAASGLPQSRILVRLPDGLVVQARLVATDERLDLAMVKVVGAEDLRPVKWGDVASCIVGQPLLAAGYEVPSDGRFAERPTFASSRLSSLRGLEGTGFFEHQASVSAGMRGGPLVTMCGEVVGVSAQGAGVDSSPDTSLALGSSAAEAKVEEWLGQR